MTSQSVAYLKHESVNSGNYIRVYCSKIVVSFSCKSNTQPNGNYGSLAKVQSQNLENPMYTITNIQLGYSGGGITEAQLKALIVANYTSESPIYLNFKYGGSNWTSFGKGSTDIPVQLNGGININVDASDSQDAYLPNFSIVLIEQYEA